MTTPYATGPLPVRTDRPRPAALRVLRALVEQGPVTIAALHAVLGGHQNSVRQHLDGLVDAGFAEEVAQTAGGRGRPARAYAATVAGRQVALQDPDLDSSGALVEAVAEHLAATPDPVPAARAVGIGWGRRLASDRRDLTEILAAQGFTPEPAPDGIALHTCPLLASAQRRPEVVCAIHQGLIDALSPEPLRLLPFAVPGACLIRPA
nr:helix-turn-helix domain-containing protein [Propionicimonas sp.]